VPNSREGDAKDAREPGRDPETDSGRQPAVVPPFGDLVLRAGPNWTAVWFFAMLGGVHLSVAVPSLLDGRWGHVSLIVGTVFVTTSIVTYRVRSEVALLTSQRRLRLRTGVGRLTYERFIPFKSIRAVRLMTEPGLRARRTESLIELLCQGEDVPCPPTPIPRQQALFMAMAIDVPLIKVSEGEPAVATQPRAEAEIAMRRR
jgi:hypothetical protein